MSASAPSPAAPFTPADEQAMRQALDQAQNAWLVGEVPVGAVLVRDDEHGVPQVVATGYNRPITTNDPTAHAELVALRHAAELLENYRLPDCTLYVTLEPCAMCAMALMHARVKRVVFGAFDPKTGAAGSVIDLFGVATLNHHTRVEGDCLGATCGAMLRAFFAERRAAQKAAQAERRAAAGGMLFGDATGPGGRAGADDEDDRVPVFDLGADAPMLGAATGDGAGEGDGDGEGRLPVALVEEVETLPVGVAVEADAALAADVQAALAADASSSPVAARVLTPAHPDASDAFPAADLPLDIDTDTDIDRGAPTTTLTLYTPAGVLATATPLRRAAKRLADLGFEVTVDEAASARHQRFGGDDDTRLAAIHRVATQAPSIAMATRGGYGLTRLLDRLDWKRLGKSVERGTRWVGLSDLTALQMGLLAHREAVTWWGPMACEDFGGETLDEITPDCFVEAMSGALEAVGFRTEAGFDGLELRGRTWGGNLAMLCSLMGTPHFPKVKGGVLLLEDVGEHPYRVERMLLQLHQAGVLARQKAVVLGAFSGWRKSPLDRGYTLKSCVDHLRTVAGVPILTGFPMGHVPTKVTVPFGVKATLVVQGRDVLLGWHDHHDH